MRIVIPAFRAARTLPDCLDALLAASAWASVRDLEIVVVDDGENGDLSLLEERYPVTVQRGEGYEGPAIGRNRGAAGFTGDVLVFLDADVLLEEAALDRLVAPIRDGVADATVGSYSGDVRGLPFSSAYKQLYVSTVYSRHAGYVKNGFWTAIGAVSADAFFEVGGFRPHLFPEEDTELGIRLTRSGKRIRAVPNAAGRHLKEHTVGTLIRNDFRKGMTASAVYFHHEESLTENRHATPRDVVAVALAFALVAATLPVALLSVPLGAAVALILLLLYSVARRDLLHSFSRLGLGFLVRAFAVMLLLDFVRSVAVGIALERAAVSRVMRAQPGLPGVESHSPTQRVGAGAPRSVGLWHRLRVLLRILGGGERMPSFVMMFVTNRCDAKCPHCFYWRDLNTTKARQELTVPEIDRLARSLGPVLQVTLTGGSPELRKDLPEVAACFHRRCRPENMTICMNGYHTDWIVSHTQRILETCPGQRLTISLSLDALGERHNEFRGMKGLFDRVVKTFELLGELKATHPELRVHCGLCVTGLNHDTAEETATWAWEHLPLDLLKVTLVRESPPPPNQETLGQACTRTYLRLIEKEDRWTHRGADSGWSPRELVVRAKEVALRQAIRETVRTGRCPVRCGASRENITIYPDGTVAGCECRPEVLGKLRDVGMDVSAIWHGSQARDFRKKVLREGCAQHHHGYLAIPVLRSPRFWPRMVRSAWDMRRERRIRPPAREQGSRR